MVNLPAVSSSTLLHDIGKLALPERIIDCQGKLFGKDLEDMHLHSRLSHAMLESIPGIDKYNSELVLYHHQNLLRTGYPGIKTGFRFGIDSQVLSMADVYDALRQKRPYRTDLIAKEEALNIIKKEHIETHKLKPFAYKSLVKYANEERKLVKVNPHWKVLYYEFVYRLRAIFLKPKQKPAYNSAR